MSIEQSQCLGIALESSSCLHNQSESKLPYATEYFTGIRSSEPNLTIGNVIGAIQPILELQELEVSDPTKKPLVFIADMHAFTDQDPRDIQTNRINILKDYLALGVDPEKTDIFVQSQIASEVLQMTMALSTLMTIKQIERVPTLKDKVGDDTKHANMFLAQYPLLMAADIILQRAHCVPTGKDQKAHIEITRDLVETINNRVGELFIPMPTTKDIEPVNILALKGDGKMSKTDQSRAIMLDDDPETIVRKIRKAQTGTLGEESPHLKSLITIGQSLAEDKRVSEALQSLYNEHLAGQGVAGKVKAVVTEIVLDYTQRYRESRALIDRSPDVLQDLLAIGAQRARIAAQETLNELGEKGIILPPFR